MPGKIELQRVSFHYVTADGQRIQALSDIDLEFNEGELIALIGQNGSGKSTLARLLNALRIPQEGNVRVFGLDTRDEHRHVAIRSQVGMVFQRPQEQIVATTVEEDVAFGPGNLGLAPREMRTRVRQALEVSGLGNLAARPTYMLSAGESQRLALAGVLAMRPRCVIFDETSAMLDPGGRRMVMDQALALNRQGILVLMITHLMEEAAQAGRVIALHRGRVVMDGPPEQVFASAEPLRSYGLGLPPAAQAANSLREVLPDIPFGTWRRDDLLAALPPYDGRAIRTLSDDRKSDSEEIIAIKNLSHTYMRSTPLAHRALDGVSLLVSQGHLHGIIGPTGCGKSTLLQHLNALLRPEAGTAEVCRLDLGNPNLDVRALRCQVALTFQQPEDQFFETYVGDEIAFGPRNLMDQPNLRQVVQAAMVAVGLDFNGYKDRLLSSLSGGEKRKVALASALAAGPRLLLLDEPLAGLDPASRAEIMDHLIALNQQGVTLVVSTHQLNGLVEWMDKISLLHAGQDQAHGHPAEIFSGKEMPQFISLSAPLAVNLSSALLAKGWPLPRLALSLAELIAMLAKGRDVPNCEPV